MTITQLEYIVAVGAYRSFVIAAEKCGITQPTLSMQVQKLEEALGVKIFDRSKQPVTPTEIGEEIIAQGRVVLAEHKKISEIITDRQREPTGELRIGIIHTLAPYLLPKLIGTFKAKYPEVKLIFEEQAVEKIINKVKSGLLDCGLISSLLQENLLIKHPLFYEPFVAYLTKNNPLQKKKNIEPEDVEVNELWLPDETQCMRKQVLNIFRKEKSFIDTGHIGYNAGSVETLKRMVDLNGGVAILPEMAISDFSDKQMDRVRYFKSPGPAREISLITQKNFVKRRIIEALQNEITELVPKRMRSVKKKEVMEG